MELHDLKEGAVVKLPYYCSEELCNVQAPIEAEIKTKAGAAQTTVAVATIAFSMVMTRLAL